MTTKDASQARKFRLVVSERTAMLGAGAAELGRSPRNSHSWEERLPNNPHLPCCISNSVLFLLGSFDKNLLGFFPKEVRVGTVRKDFGKLSTFLGRQNDYLFGITRQFSYTVVKNMVFLTREVRYPNSFKNI